MPTPRGYRFFVDSLLTVCPLERPASRNLEDRFQSAQPQQLISNASHLLSGLTHFAGIVIAPRRAAPRIRQIEFISLSEKRILLILVTADGDVQNRILLTERGYSPAELVTAANILNQHFAGLDFDQIRHRLQEELRQLRTDLQSLMSAARPPATRPCTPPTPLRDQRRKNLLEVEEFSSNMKRLRELFDLFEQRTGLVQLLDVSSNAEGVQIFIGGESGLAPLDECSVVTAPYEVNGQIVGSVGVIGPTRMAYERVIPIVDITAKLLSSALTYQANS